MSARFVLKRLSVFMPALFLAACATRENPLVLHVSGTEEAPAQWTTSRADRSYVQTYTACANSERSVTDFYLPAEGDFFIFGYRLGEEQGPASVTIHHLSFKGGKADARDAAGQIMVALLFPILIPVAIVAAPFAIARRVEEEKHRPRKQKNVPDCYTWVEDVDGATVSGKPPFRGVGDF